MLRISLPWLYEVVRSVDGLSSVSAGLTYSSAFGVVYSAMTQLDALFSGSLYKDALTTSRQPGAELREVLAAFLVNDLNSQISDLDAWQVATKRETFRTVFMAELATIPSYYVAPKLPYNTNTLLEAGEHLMPSALAAKAPEAVFDFREAGKGIAFDMGTASAFHAFRGMERVLRRYLNEICGSEAPSKNRNLGVYIRALAQANADDGIVAALKQIKDLHRNPLIHPDVAIGTDEAISALGMIRSVVAVMLEELPMAQQTTATAGAAGV